MSTDLLLHLVLDRAVGLWRESVDSLSCVYISEAPEDEKRARQFLDSRGSSVSWESWFSVMSEHSPYTDQYVLVPDSGEPLLQQLQELRMSVTLGEPI